MPGAGRLPNPRTVKKRSGASEQAADRTQGRTAATRAPPNGSHGRRAAVKPAPRPRRAEADRSFDDTAARHGGFTGFTPSATARVRLNIESCSTLIRSELRGCVRVTRLLTVDYARRGFRRHEPQVIDDQRLATTGTTTQTNARRKTHLYAVRTANDGGKGDETWDERRGATASPFQRDSYGG